MRLARDEQVACRPGLPPADPSAMTRRSSPRTITRSAMIGTMSSSWVAVMSVLPDVAEPPDEVHEDPLRARIERRGRLVEQDDVRTKRQDRRDGRPLLLAPGELERRPVGEVGDLHRGEGFVAALPSPLPGSSPAGAARTRRRRRRVALNSWMSGSWKTSPTSRWKRNASLPAATAATSRAQRPHRPAGRPDDPVEQLEQGRLAAPVGAEQHDLLAGPDVEVDAVERDLPARVDVADAAQVETRLLGPVLAVGRSIGAPGGAVTGRTARPARPRRPARSSRRERASRRAASRNAL